MTRSRPAAAREAWSRRSAPPRRRHRRSAPRPSGRGRAPAGRVDGGRHQGWSPGHSDHPVVTQGTRPAGIARSSPVMVTLGHRACTHSPRQAPRCTAPTSVGGGARPRRRGRQPPPLRSACGRAPGSRSANASDLRPSPTCGAGVDVEQPHATRAGRPAPSRSAASTSAAGTAASTTSATSSLASGKVETGGAGRIAAGAVSSRSRSSSAAQVRAGSPSALDDPRVQLARVADDGRRRPAARAAAGVPGRVLVRRDARAAGRRRGRRAGRPRRRRAQSAGRPGPHQPAGSRSPVSTHGHVPRLARQRGVERRRAPRRSGARSTGGRGAGRRPPVGPEDQARSRTARGRVRPRPTLRPQRRRAAPAAAWCAGTARSSDSGLASRTARRRGSSAGSPSASSRSAPTNG